MTFDILISAWCMMQPHNTYISHHGVVFIQTEPRFQCILTNDSETEPDNTEPLYFKQEEGKKSSFLLNLDDGATTISKPAQIVITSVPQDKFLFGGLELVSNARNVEIYLTDQDDKEAYLTTCRGIVAGDAIANTFKCLVVCPGGPRPVLRVRLKLLSLKPESCTGASLHLIKLKGRLPPPKEPQQEATTDASSAMSRQAPPPPTNNTPASPALTQGDMGAAMAGVSMLVRSVESSLLQSVQASLDRMEKKFDARFDRIEQYLMLQQQQALIQQQQQQERYNTLQSQQMVQMKEQQNELVSLIGSLQAQLHNQPLADQVSDATTDQVRGKIQSESIKESKLVEDDDKVDDEQVVSDEKVSKSPLVSREESSEPELATDKAHDSWETAEQEDKVGKAESGALLDTKEKGGLEYESCADKESSEDKRFGNAASTDSNDEVDERENSNTEESKGFNDLQS